MKSISKIPIVAHGIQRKLSKLHLELRNVLCCEQKRRAIIVQVLLVLAVCFFCARILLPFVPKVRMQKRDINGIITGHPKNKHTQHTHRARGIKRKVFNTAIRQELLASHSSTMKLLQYKCKNETIVASFFASVWYLLLVLVVPFCCC